MLPNDVVDTSPGTLPTHSQIPKRVKRLIEIAPLRLDGCYDGFDGDAEEICKFLDGQTVGWL